MQRNKMRNVYGSDTSFYVNLLFNISQIFLYTFALTTIVSSLFFIFNIGIHVWTLPASAIFAMILFKFLNKSQTPGMFLVSCVFALLIFSLLTALCGSLLDFSWDGNAYHKVAVGLLNHGWNPLYQDPAKIGQPILQGRAPYLWAECYPKATWIFGASIYAMTGNIECGKVYTLVSIFSTFGITLFFLRSLGYGKIFAILFSLAAASNPIALAQFDTFYLDGCLQLLLYILILSLIVSISDIPLGLKHITNALVASCMILCFNIKFTGALFVCLYCSLFFVVWCFYVYFTDKGDFFRRILKKTAFLGIVGFIAAFLAGSSTYITNYIHHGNIGYPLIGKNKIDIMSSTAFESRNRVSNLLYSLFSYQENLEWRHAHRKPILKIPFTYSLEREHKIAHEPKTDIRIGAFGPFFSGVLLLSLIFMGVRFIRHPREPASLIMMCLLFAALVLCAILYESWWARYAPYIYYMVLCGICAAYLSSSSLVRGLGMLMCLMLILNNSYYLLRIPTLVEAGNAIAREIDKMKKHDTVLYKFGPLAHGTYFNLLDAGIRPRRDENIEQKCKATLLGDWASSWCPQPRKSK